MSPRLVYGVVNPNHKQAQAQASLAFMKAEDGRKTIGLLSLRADSLQGIPCNPYLLSR
jgi:hypothetical protein